MVQTPVETSLIRPKITRTNHLRKLCVCAVRGSSSNPSTAASGDNYGKYYLH